MDVHLAVASIIQHNQQLYPIVCECNLNDDTLMLHRHVLFLLTEKEVYRESSGSARRIAASLPQTTLASLDL